MYNVIVSNPLIITLQLETSNVRSMHLHLLVKETEIFCLVTTKSYRIIHKINRQINYIKGWIISNDGKGRI